MIENIVGPHLSAKDAATHAFAGVDRLRAINADLVEVFPELIGALADLHAVLNNRILGTGANPAENIEFRRECEAACGRARTILENARAGLASAEDASAA